MVQARSFASNPMPFAAGKPEWVLTLRVTDRSAAGAAGASDAVRTYRCTRTQGPNTLVMRDESDGTEFTPEPNLADALAPWTGS